MPSCRTSCPSREGVGGNGAGACDLREIVFNQQRSVPQEKEEPAKIAFPYRTDRRVIAFGGHDSWLREIKFKVPDVRFMGEDISSAR